MRIWGLAGVAIMMLPGTAFAKGWELDSPQERLAEIVYGLENVCLPAQRVGQKASDYEEANRSNLTLVRRQNRRRGATPMWGVDARSDVVITEEESGCTISTSFRQDQADRLIPDLRGRLTDASSAYQVVTGDPENFREPLGVAFCLTNGSDGVDSVMLYERVEPELESGRREPRDILYLSIVVPMTGFCPAPATEQ